MTDQPSPESGYLTVDFRKADGRTLEEVQAQAAELWVRYRPDERAMLSGFFRSIVESVTLCTQNQVTHVLIQVVSDAADPMEQIDADLGTAMARILALIEDPRTGEGARAMWLSIGEQVREMRGNIGQP